MWSNRYKKAPLSEGYAYFTGRIVGTISPAPMGTGGSHLRTGFCGLLRGPVRYVCQWALRICGLGEAWVPSPGSDELLLGDGQGWSFPWPLPVSLRDALLQRRLDDGADRGLLLKSEEAQRLDCMRREVG